MEAPYHILSISYHIETVEYEYNMNIFKYILLLGSFDEIYVVHPLRKH
jgi:hypothetical protein